MSQHPTSDGRLIRGQQTRNEILNRAVDLASIEGLDGLTIGRLAKDLQLSKSGLIRHFGTKEEMQVATVSTARDRFAQMVLAEAITLEPGLARLETTIAAWLEYLVSDTFAGGCFFYAVAPEVDRQNGPVRQAVLDAVSDGLQLMRQDIEAAQAATDLTAGVDPDQLVFEIHALIQEANLWHLLLDDDTATDRSRQAIDSLLTRHRT
jgi:AcrR family transcriptional regulator